ncbi:hypothetical protein H0H93_006675, partial [Arthromyces matolae]
IPARGSFVAHHRVYEEWEKKYPERVATFPDLSPTDELTEAQLTTLQKAIEKRQAQIQSWFRWRTQKKGRQADKNVSKQLQKVLLGSQERLPQLPHIYSDMFYDTKIAPVVEQQTPAGATNADRFAIANRVTRAMFAAEDPAVVDEVRARFAVLKREKDERAERLGLAPTLQDIEKNLENLPAYMGRFLEFLHTSTGWSFSCIMGGPDPSMKNEISVKSYHVGWSPAGKDFSRHYRSYEEDVMVPYTEFLHSVSERPVDEVSIKSSLGTDTGGSLIEGSTLKIAVQGDKGKVGSQGDANAGKKSSPTRITVVAAIQPAVTVIPQSISSIGSMDHPRTGGWNGTGGTDGVMSTLYSGFDGHTAENFSIPNIYDFDLIFPANSGIPPWHFGTSGCFSPTGSLAPTQPVLNLTSTLPANSSDPANRPFSSVNSGPAINPAINTGISPAVSTVPIISDPAINSVSPIISDPAVNSVSPIISDPAVNSVSPIIADPAINSVSPIISGSAIDPANSAINSAPPIISGPAINSVSPIISGSAIDPANSAINSAPPIISGPAINSVSPIISGFAIDPANSAINSAPPIIPNSSVNRTTNREPVYHFPDPTSLNFGSISAIFPIDQNPVHSPTSDGTTTTADEPLETNGTTVSRSGRLIVPSSRAEKLNEIGTHTVRVPDGKENVNPDNVPCPEWIIQGLPGTKKRPEEWQRWTTKSKRLYSDTPAIRDPMEFGLAVVNWWKEIQPPVRQASATLMPVAIKDIPNLNENMWTALRKGGPNGMITLVTLLAWWGQRAIIGNQYQEDSTALWKECVVDVRTCLEEMTRNVPVPVAKGQKRSAPSTDRLGSKRVKKM